MRAAQIIVDIVNGGGFIVAEKGEIVARKVPSHLIPHIRERKAELLALLSPQPFTPLPSEECADAYAMAERVAIQSEDNMPPDRGWDDVAGFEGMPSLSPAEHGAILHRLTNAPLQAPAPAPMQPAPAMAPQRVSCGSCARFQPGTTKMGIGVCLATTNGQPPQGQRGYLAAYPMAQRQCPEFSGVGS